MNWLISADKPTSSTRSKREEESLGTGLPVNIRTEESSEEGGKENYSELSLPLMGMCRLYNWTVFDVSDVRITR